MNLRTEAVDDQENVFNVFCDEGIMLASVTVDAERTVIDLDPNIDNEEDMKSVLLHIAATLFSK